MARNPVLDQLQEEIARYEVELAGLEQTHQAAHPEVKSIMAKVQQARKRMSEVDPQVRMQDTSALNPIHENLERKVLDRIAQRDLLLSRGAALDDVIAKMRGEVQELSHQKAEYGRLSLALDLREVEYRLVSEEYAEARLAAAEDISEIRILHPAIPPVYPEGPWKILYAGGGLAIGFLLAFSVLLVRDYAEPALVTAEDVQEALDAPVLATVPRKNMPAGTIALLGEGSSSDAFAWRMLLEDESHVKGGSGDE
jgi:uncharacterized protein involved in exopolysaccharide biosynthesis